MKTLYIAIYDLLKTIPEIAWVDEDFGQIDNYVDRPSVKFPCALVMIDESDESLGSDAYDITSTITVRVAHSRLGDRTAMAEETAFERTIDKLDDVDRVIGTLEGYELEDVCGRIYIKGVVSERRTDGIAAKVITFTETH
jgi:hypothetical protein